MSRIYAFQRRYCHWLDSEIERRRIDFQNEFNKTKNDYAKYEMLIQKQKL